MWIMLVHDCDPNGQADIVETGASPGSVWQCEFDGCGRFWEMTALTDGIGEWKAFELPKPEKPEKEPKPEKSNSPTK